jgi:phage gp36-like protein
MASATQNVPSATLDAALSGASRTLDGYFRGRFSLPLTDWDDSVRRMTCWIAAYDVMTARGFSQDAGRDIQIQERYNAAIAWAEGGGW